MIKIGLLLLITPFLYGCTDGILPEFQSYKYINNSSYSLEFFSYRNSDKLDLYSFEIDPGEYYEHVEVIRLGDMYPNLFAAGGLTQMEVVLNNNERLIIKCLGKSPLGYEHCLDLTPEFDFISKPTEKYTIGDKPIKVQGKRVEFWNVFEITDEDLEGLKSIQERM